jgi:hypothetical protein
MIESLFSGTIVERLGWVLVPSGSYTLHAYGRDDMKGKDATVTVNLGQREVTVEPSRWR